MFHAIHDQLLRLERVSQTATKIRADRVNYLRSNQQFQTELISVNLLWNTYLRRMAMEVEWGEWIALWGLINMLQIPVAIVLSLGETGLKVIYPADSQNEV